MTGHVSPDDALQFLCDSGHVVNIGQLSDAAKRALDKWAALPTNNIVKFKGRWFPLAGCPDGIGPLKTVWALPAYHAFVTGEAGKAAAKAQWDELAKVEG